MKRSLTILAPAVALAAILASCGGNQKTDEPVTVSSYAEHRDARYKFAVKYPENWATAAGSGIAAFYSSQIIADGFATFDPKGNRGGKIELGTAEGGPEKVTSMVEELRAVLTDTNNMGAAEQLTLNGLPATKVRYAFNFGDGTPFTAERYFVANGGLVTWLETAVIGDYAAYATVFDSVRASFVPGQLQVAAVPDTTSTTGRTTTPPPVRDSVVTEAPDVNLKTYSGAKFTMGYPTNFSAVGSSGGVTFSGARNDSRVQVDVKPAKGMSLADVQGQYAKSLKASAGSATVGGQKGAVFNMSPTATVSRRVYIAVVNDNLYQITMDSFKPQASSYQPVYDKMIASFRAR